MIELSMKHLSESDLPFLYSLLTDSHVAKKLHWQPSSLDELKSYYQNEWRDEDEVHFIIRWKDHEIGWLKMNNLKGKDTLWISMLAILPYYSGRGLAQNKRCVLWSCLLLIMGKQNWQSRRQLIISMQLLYTSNPDLYWRNIWKIRDIMYLKSNC